MAKEPIPSFEWIITDKCNYDCAYCYQRKYADKRHSPDEVTDAVFALLGSLPGSWRVKLIGGEPFIHPRFIDLCRRIAGAGHFLSTTTNLYASVARLREFLDACGGKLTTLTASLHLTQVKNLDEFIDKAAEFHAAKRPSTRFCVTSVLIEEDFERLRRIEERLAERGVPFEYQVLRVRARFVRYRPEIEAYLADRTLKRTDVIRKGSLFGTLCHTGHLFFKIDVNGDVTRCYNHQPHFYLGNIARGTFRRFDGPQPCLSPHCTCVTPANRNMIRFGEKATAHRIIRRLIGGTPGSVPYVAGKAWKAWRNRR
ncbi:MAG: radical SAM protein [Phycisphaerae bacterium]|nr:radical SAM protein [Phycisphaerae bacterium]